MRSSFSITDRFIFKTEGEMLSKSSVLRMTEGVGGKRFKSRCNSTEEFSGS